MDPMVVVAGFTRTIVYRIRNKEEEGCKYSITVECRRGKIEERMLMYCMILRWGTWQGSIKCK